MSAMMEDLLEPAAFPDETRSVSLVQTHISLVFIADAFVYKVKKPVNFGFLDFTSLENRAHACRQEVLLNRRLAPEIYEGVLPVVFDGFRHRVGAGHGEVVDHAVKMRRIPEERLMKAVFARGELNGEDVERVARVLADFHRTAQRSPEIDAFGRAEAFRVNTDENFAQVEKYCGTSIDQPLFEALRQWTVAFYRDHAALFEERIAAGRVRDCHGDLHMEHICLSDGIPIFDCIEFNDRFRYGDTLADVAFLMMDLDYHGGAAFSNLFWEAYRRFAEEGEGEELLTFYKVYRAFVRGKVISFQLDDPGIEAFEKEKAVRSARAYFELAGSYL